MSAYQQWWSYWGARLSAYQQPAVRLRGALMYYFDVYFRTSKSGYTYKVTVSPEIRFSRPLRAGSADRTKRRHVLLKYLFESQNHFCRFKSVQVCGPASSLGIKAQDRPFSCSSRTLRPQDGRELGSGYQPSRAITPERALQEERRDPPRQSAASPRAPSTQSSPCSSQDHGQGSQRARHARLHGRHTAPGARPSGFTRTHHVAAVSSLLGRRQCQCPHPRQRRMHYEF